MITRLKPTEDGTPGLKALQKRFASMKRERDNLVPRWRRISNMVVPARGKFDDERPDTLDDRDRYLIDVTPTRALETLQAGMQSGLTSPSRPWFKLQVADQALAGLPSVQKWCDDVRDRLLAIIARSNLYGCFYSLYGELGAFGTGALIIEEDEEEIIHGRVLTAGEYFVSFDSRSMPAAFARVVWMTAEQIVSRFGEDSASEAVRNAVSRNEPDTWFKVNHMIVRDAGRNTDFPVLSVYWEDGRETETELDVGGFEEFPVLVPRWETTGEDNYGRGPGMLAASEAATLHQLRRDHLIANKKVIDPPLVAPVSARDFGVDKEPGGVSYAPADMSHRALYQVNFDISAHMAAIGDSRQFINQLFYADLFLMIASLDQNMKMTATEAQIRKEEKLQMLGPVTERLTHEMLDPAITRTFMIALRRNELPEPPRELMGSPVRIEYISILAMAQIAGSITDIQTFLATFGSVAQVSPEVADKLNADEITDQLVRISNVPAAILRDDETVAELRQQRAAAMQQAQQMEQANQEAAAMKQGAGAVRDLANAPAGEGNVLNELSGMIEGGVR